MCIEPEKSNQRPDDGEAEDRELASIGEIEHPEVLTRVDAAHDVAEDREGTECDRPETGAEAVEKACQLRPDAITLDILMPGGSGFGTLAELKRRVETAPIPIIVVSVLDQKEVAFTLGAADYLVKPVQKSVLLNTLGKHLRTTSGPSTNILVVDDDPATLEVVSDTLRSGGYTPHAVSSGKEALELLSKVRMDAILLDLMMPEMDGFDVLRTIRENPELEEIPVFVVTAKDLTEAESRLLKHRVRALFRKDQAWKADLLAQLRKAVGTRAFAKTVGQS